MPKQTDLKKDNTVSYCLYSACPATFLASNSVLVCVCVFSSEDGLFILLWRKIKINYIHYILFRQYVVPYNNYDQHSVYCSWSCRCTYIIVVTTALSAEGRLVVELVLEIVLTQVPQGCAHLRMLQLFLWRRDFIDTHFSWTNTWPELHSVVLIFVLTADPKTTHTFCGHSKWYLKTLTPQEKMSWM